MPEPTTAEQLDIGEGFAVWVFGGSLETDSLLDPLPEAAYVVESEDGEPVDSLDAAVLAADGVADLRRVLDEALPRLGSVDPVWLVHPDDGYAAMTPDDVFAVLDDFGWAAYAHLSLGDTWSAMRIAPL